MPILVTVTYFSHEYTYEITTDDNRRFVCQRQALEGDEPLAAPPERMRLVLGEEPKADVWGENLLFLYRQLMQKLTEHLGAKAGQA